MQGRNIMLVILAFVMTATLSTETAIASNSPEGKSAGEDERDLPYKYWGNSFSLKFHRPSCPFAQAMNPRHLELFHFRREAIEKGEKPCRYCLPPYWTSVHCVLLSEPSKKAIDTNQSLPASAKHQASDFG